ncbi:uncharacterized protein LOC122023444 isoform X1 [Zingiber officinale]|uniref:U1-type domain-containing protein n=1 Tax=Zingiber officinale TaxID=94328 RepID=A0A8J5EZE5_ZINOF|nr:uncharacterized protein LOC122023444 isoform X1 [Zingiber officinale]KAG6477589.1 hypothetical protein ZIOFF_066856 [Zingiber officinale]
MDDATFNEAHQQHRLLQYQPIQAYDPSQPIFHAAHSAYHHQQHHPYDLHPSDYPYRPYHSIAPPPPAAVSATLPGASQIHAPTALHGDLRMAAPPTHHGAPEPSSFGFSTPLGTNPLASQVPAAWTFGTLDRAAVAIPHPQVGGGYTQRGGGRRGRFSFRGGRGRGNGNFSLNPSKHGVGEPSYNGRGRGQGTKGKRGSSLNHLSITSQSPNPAIVSMTGSLSVVDGNPTPAVSAALQSKVPMQPLFPIAWCDICRVDCNRLEVLEQHKNGKRHKKTVQKLQEIQAQQNLMADLHSNYVGKSELLFPSMEGANLPSLAETNIFSHLRGEKIVTSAPVSSGQVGEAENAIAISGNTSFTLETAPTSETNIKPTPSVTVVSSEVSEANRCSAASESLMPAIAGIGHKVEPEVPCQTVATQSESSKEERAEKEATTSTMPDFIDVPDCIDVPAVEGRRRIARMTTGRGRMARMNNYDRRHGTKKRAMSYQLDGRRLKRHEVAGARNQERQKHQPMVCTVCNVRCDTLAVFECHLSGKKHISKIKRSQGQNTVFGRITVDILPSQSTTCAPQGPEPLFYGLLSPDVFQKAAGVAEGAQTEAIAFSSQSQQQQQLQPEIVAVGSQSQQPQVQSEGSIPSSKLQEEATNMHIKGLPSVPKIESDEPCQLPDSPKELDPTGDFLFMPTLSK